MRVDDPNLPFNLGSFRALQDENAKLRGALQGDQKPLSVDDIWNSDAIMAVNADFGAPLEVLVKLVRAVEIEHNIKGK